MSVQWEAKYSLNISDIDSQHKRFFYLLDQTKCLYSENKGNLLAHVKQIKETILELEKYSITHFLMEERAMEDTHYPNFESHKAQHIKFTNEIENFITQLKNDEIIKDEIRLNDFLEKIIRFINSWFTNHIQMKDIELKPFVKSL
jgi:hemerythrin